LVSAARQWALLPVSVGAVLVEPAWLPELAEMVRVLALATWLEPPA